MKSDHSKCRMEMGEKALQISPQTPVMSFTLVTLVFQSNTALSPMQFEFDAEYGPRFIKDSLGPNFATKIFHCSHLQ